MKKPGTDHQKVGVNITGCVQSYHSVKCILIGCVSCAHLRANYHATLTLSKLKYPTKTVLCLL